jgi:signal peptidase I
MDALVKNKAANEIVDTIKTIVYAVVIALVVRTVAYEPFNIPSGSMIPTLLIGDYLFVSKFSYGYSHYSLPLSPRLFSGRIFAHQPHQGDVVVFKWPGDNSTDYIKRLIGLPGDRIRVTNGILYVNGIEAKRQRVEDYAYQDPNCAAPHFEQYIETLPNGVKHRIIKKVADQGSQNNFAEFTVPANSYFMMGDNRDCSSDSRFWGPVPAENLIGKAQFIFFSVSADDGIPWWEFWNWPFEIQYGRLFEAID